MVQASDGGYVIGGRASALGNATLVKTDSTGSVQWQKAYDTVASVVQTKDLGYVLFCQNDTVKIDADGNFESSFSIGLNGSGTVEDGIVTRDGDYLLVGNSFGAAGDYAWLYKFDAQGNLLWNSTYTGGVSVYTVTETADRGCAIAGNSKNNFWLSKIDSNGNLQWSHTYSEGDTLDRHFVYSMVQSKDGGFLLAGSGDWHESGGYVPWLLKVNSQGHVQFSLPYGHIPNDVFCEVLQTEDEGYALVMRHSPTLVRTDSSGSELWQLTLDSEEEWASIYRASSLIQTRDGGYAIAGAVFVDTAFIVKVSPEPDTQPPVITISKPTSKTYEHNEVPLVITTNEPVSWIAYSLDGEPVVTINGNTTLSGLTVGTHDLKVSAQDLAGLVGSSSTIHFTIAAPFPTELVFAGIAIAAGFIVSFLAYFKRESISAYKKQGLTSFLKQHLTALAKNRTLWTLTITGLSILLVFTQIFFPYAYFSAAAGNSNSNFEVGVTYVYEQDNIGMIYDEVSHIKDVGFDVIRVNMICVSIDPSHYLNTLTDVFFSAVKQLGIKVALIINNHESFEDINFYLDRWGSYLTYIQVLNEPDVASSWDMGALFTDDEAGSKFEEVYTIVDQHHLSAQYYTNFGPSFMLRTNLPIKFSEKLDFVGFDVFMDSFLTLSPRMIQLLQKITNKDIVIAEFGMSTSDDTEQSDYIIKGLNLFKSMNLKGCWLVYWNSVDNIYGIRGRLTEQKVGEWIAQNT